MTSSSSVSAVGLRPRRPQDRQPRPQRRTRARTRAAAATARGGGRGTTGPRRGSRRRWSGWWSAAGRWRGPRRFRTAPEEHEDAPRAQQEVTRRLADGGGRRRRRRVLRVSRHGAIRVPRAAAPLGWGHAGPPRERAARLRLGVHDPHRRAGGAGSERRTPRPRSGTATTPATPRSCPDGRPLGEWLADEGAAAGAPARLPYLLKVLAAASPLSIQAHPSKTQAEEGFAREEAAGIPRDAAERTYRDDNHKPELIVAVSETFTALAGLRDPRRHASARSTHWGRPAARSPASGRRRMPRPPCATRSRGCSPATRRPRWTRSSRPRRRRMPRSSRAELALSAASSNAADPGDPGVVVALLMNLVVLHRGEAVFVPAGVLHAYVAGPGRRADGGERQRAARRPHAQAHRRRGAAGGARSDPRTAADPPARDSRRRTRALRRRGIPDFALLHMRSTDDAPVDVPIDGSRSRS